MDPTDPKDPSDPSDPTDPYTPYVPNDPKSAYVTNEVPTPGSLALVVMGMSLMVMRRRQIRASIVILPQLYADK